MRQGHYPLSFGFEGMMGDWIIDPKIYSFAKEDDSDNADVTFRNDMKDIQ